MVRCDEWFQIGNITRNECDLPARFLYNRAVIVAFFCDLVDSSIYKAHREGDFGQLEPVADGDKGWFTPAVMHIQVSGALHRQQALIKLPPSYNRT